MTRCISKYSAYLSSIPSHQKLDKYPLTMLDSSKLEGIQANIPLFKDVKFSDIAFITKRFETLNLFRGCKLGCSHCLKNALAPKIGRESILFEDLKRFVNGFKILNERLGFDALNGNKYINIIDDSNPTDNTINGLKRSHTVVEAMKLIYDKLNIPTLFVTSGLSNSGGTSSKYSQKVAKDIVDMVKKSPSSVEDVQISINPFLTATNYAYRMARTLAAFLDLFKIDKAHIIYRHSQDGYKNYDEEAAKNIYYDIYYNLKQLTGLNLNDFPQLRPEVVTKFDKNHLIEPSGRGRKFFSKEQNFILQQELIQDSLDWQAMTPEEQRENLLNNALKCIDIDGSVYTTKPSSAQFVATPIELTIPTNIKLNYINKEKPNKIFSDIEC